MLDALMETIGALGLLASATVHYSRAKAQTESPGRDPEGCLDCRSGTYLTDAKANRVGGKRPFRRRQDCL
jgi:hypothetical protein